MLDQLDLVHMNGRVYDPLLGKFVSADPILQDPMNGQSYNRFAYVLNNPTNLTDPTGFASEGCAGKIYCSMIYIADMFGNFEFGGKTHSIQGPNIRSDIAKNPGSEGRACAAGSSPDSCASVMSAGGAGCTPGVQCATVVRATNSVMTGANDRQLLNQKPCSTPSVECSKFNAERAEAYGRWQEKSSGAVESVCVECYVAGAGGAIKAGYTSVKGLFVAAEEAVALRFSQTTASSVFSKKGDFAGSSIASVAADLRSGVLTVQQVPVQYVVKDGVQLIVNTRSSLALQRAGISREQWVMLDKSAVPEIQARISQRLIDNNLTTSGTSTLRITGKGKNVSNLE
jgi:RHS repeat-associated protein